MRRQWTIIPAAILIIVGICGLWMASQAIAAKAVEGSQFVGGWSGTWEGGGTGKFDLTLTAAADGTLSGSVAVGTDGGDYNAQFKSLVFVGNKLTATYDYPLDAQGEIALTGTFAATDATGTWTLGPKGAVASNPMATGTYALKKK